MQTEGKPVFFQHHSKRVKGVAYSPKDRYLFCSGAYDGKVNLYSALSMKLLMSCSITSEAITQKINAIRFSHDGSKILACTTSGRLSVVDVERGQELFAYGNCAGGRRNRTGLATDPVSPNIAVTVGENGKGLTLLDMRMPLPLDYVNNLHFETIRDIVFLEPSWPWATSNGLLLTAASDGCCKVCTMDGQILHTFFTSCYLNTVCSTPEPYQSLSPNVFYSAIMCGGEKVTSYVPNLGTIENFYENGDKPIWKVRYTSNGSFLYSACADGIVRKYRRYQDRHEYLGIVFTHQDEIQDLDISPYDEYLITASNDHTVGVLCLGAPSHGSTIYGELT